MNKKILYFLVAVLVVVVAAAAVAGAYLMYNGGFNAGTNNPENLSSIKVANATSLSFTVNVTIQGITEKLAFYAKNMGTSNLTVRVDIFGGEAGNWSQIFDTGQQKSWNSTNNGAWMPGDFTADWSYWGDSWTNLFTNLKNWSGTGEYSYYSSNGDFHKIYDIAVNPALADSLFQVS